MMGSWSQLCQDCAANAITQLKYKIVGNDIGFFVANVEFNLCNKNLYL